MQPVPPETIHKFYGCASNDEVVQNREFQHNVDAFFAPTGEFCGDRGSAGQDMDDATKVFYGVQEKPQGLKLGAPIPGYSGHNRRFEADNIFGSTFQASRVNAAESNQRIDFEKGETLKTTCKFMPSYEQARQARQC